MLFFFFLEWRPLHTCKILIQRQTGTSLMERWESVRQIWVNKCENESSEDNVPLSNSKTAKAPFWHLLRTHDILIKRGQERDFWCLALPFIFLEGYTTILWHPEVSKSSTVLYSRFCLLSEAHKSINLHWPVVSVCSCLQPFFSAVLESLMRLLIEFLPFNIKDTSHALQLFNRFCCSGDHWFIFTRDIQSL